MTKQYYTYLYIDPKTQAPVYIGYGTAGRAWGHFTAQTRGREPTQLRTLLEERIEQGYMPAPILHFEASKEEALEMEKFWIAFYGRQDLGEGTLFNKTSGGAGSKGYALGLNRLS